MRSLLIFTTIVLLLASACAAQSKNFGNYYNKWRYWGPMFILKADSTFEYFHRTNAGTVTTTNEINRVTTTTDSYILSDSSYGKFKIINDTLFLHYATDELQGDFNGYNLRPTKLYWKRKSLYYIHVQTGTVLKQKEYYMRWSKWRAPNLSKADETYLQRTELR